MKAIAVFAALLVPAPAFAALPSPYQRAAELTAVIEAAVGVLEVYTIESVRFLEVDRYEVETLRCRLVVEIVDIVRDDAPMMVGPRQFEAVAGEPECEEQ